MQPSTNSSEYLKKILIIEDEPDISDYLFETLAISGYEARQAYDGIEALEKIKEEKPALVLLDVMMPRLDGFEVCRRIRANKETSSIRVIFITAKGSLEEKLEGFNAGADDFLVKPFSSSELLARIEAHLRIDSLKKDLELSEKRYRQLIEHSPDGILLFSPESELVFFNRRLKSILPFKNLPITNGQSIKELLLLSPLFEEIELLIDKVKGSNLLVTRNLSFFLGNEQSVFLEIRGIPAESQGTKVPMVQIVIRDVTEKYNMEKVLTRAEKINSLGILTAGIAHEINNPLTGISNAIQILKKSSISIDKREDLLDLVLTNIGRISRIIEDLRVFSRQERAESGSFSLVPAIEETLKLVSYQKENDQIKIDFEHSNEDLTLTGSKNQFQQVMVNLLLNSSQAILGEGYIKVRLVKDIERDTVFIEIKDSGCGIPESQLEQIFDPFFTTKRDWKGTGLGLAVSYRLVQLLKGTITVKSKENVGTSFRLNFPIAQKSQSSANL